MDFGFYLPCYWPDVKLPAQHMYRETVEEAKFAEDVGFTSVSIPEHHFINYLTHPSPLLTAVKVAAVTKRIPIITAVLPWEQCPTTNYTCQTPNVIWAEGLRAVGGVNDAFDVIYGGGDTNTGIARIQVTVPAGRRRRV